MTRTSGIGLKILKPHSAIPQFLLGRDPEDRSPVASRFLETILLPAGCREADSLSPALSKSVDRASWMGTSTLERVR
jgi:hypothetical protein